MIGELIEYKTILVYDTDYSCAQETLNNRVKYELLNGWKLKGSVSISVISDSAYGYRIYLVQAMIR